MAMGMKGFLVLTLGLAMAATSSAVTYKVGDSSGWTILGNINYTDWTTKKNFHVGDIIGKFGLSLAQELLQVHNSCQCLRSFSVRSSPLLVNAAHVSFLSVLLSRSLRLTVDTPFRSMFHVWYHLYTTTSTLSANTMRFADVVPLLKVQVYVELSRRHASAVPHCSLMQR